MTSNHDAKIPFGIETPQGNRKIIIQRQKLYLKFQDGRHQPYWKTCTTHCPKYLCCRKYYDICFLANLRSLVLGRHTLGQDSVSCAGMVALLSFLFESSILDDFSRGLFI